MQRKRGRADKQILVSFTSCVDSEYWPFFVFFFGSGHAKNVKEKHGLCLARVSVSRHARLFESGELERRQFSGKIKVSDYLN